MASKEKKTVLLYSPAKEKMASIWAYSNQWGEVHADLYLAALYEALQEQQDKRKHRPFPKANTSDITDDQVYFSL